MHGRKMSEQTAELIVNRLRLIVPEAGRHAPVSITFIGGVHSGLDEWRER